MGPPARCGSDPISTFLLLAFSRASLCLPGEYQNPPGGAGRLAHPGLVPLRVPSPHRSAFLSFSFFKLAELAFAGP